MFPAAPKARADLRPGILYAIDGGDGHTYYGHITASKDVGFYRFRSLSPRAEEAVAHPIMARFSVNWPSLGRALRKGLWYKLGPQPLPRPLLTKPERVQWPVGTLQVSVWRGDEVICTTRVDDPAIQHLEIMATYEADAHVSPRLVAQFQQSSDAWKVAGSVWSHRRAREDLAARFPDQPWHALPEDWAPSGPAPPAAG